MSQTFFSFSGFRDGHCHPLFAAREAAGPKLDHCTSVAQIQTELRKFRAENPTVTWIDCGSYEPNLAAAGRLLAVWLDEAVADIPVVVHASDHHTIWVNSAALATANLTNNVPVFKSASIDVDENGQATGVLREWDAMSLIYAHQPKPTLEDDLKTLESAQLQLLSRGIVAVQEAWIDEGMPEVYLAAAKLDSLKLRVDLAPRIAPDTWQRDLEFAIATRLAVTEANNELLTCNTVKIFVDGVFGSQTAFLNEPYCAGGHGSALWQQQELVELANKADAAGFQLHFHAIGDAAVSFALDALELAFQTASPRQRRPVIAHAELIASQDFTRLAKLGVIVCQQPAWIIRDDQWETTAAAIGTTRAEALYPLKTLLDSSVVLSFGSDWPVSQPNPLIGLRNATERGGNAHSGFGLEQRLSRAQALHAYSEAVAYQLGQEFALNQDRVILDGDPTDETTDLTAVKVLAVEVAQRLVFGQLP